MKCLRDASRVIFLLALMGLLFSVNPSSAPAQTPPLDAPPLLLDDPLDEQSLEDLENELFDSEDSEELDDSGDERSRRGGLRRYFPRWRAGDAYERNHRSVRQAFREPVREASRATIQVFADNERVAMGTIVDPNGLVFTKASEIGGELECRLRDGRRVKAHLISVREELDLAILRIEADNLPVIQWRDSAVPLEGSWLATTGMQEIPTAVGVVSVSPREIPTPQAVLGVMLDNADLGPRITGIIPESAAEEAGVQVDDIVSDLNGLPMPNREVFIEAIQRKRPGDRIEMTVLRGDQRVAINAKLQEKNRILQGKRIDFQNNLGGKLSDRRWGFPSVIQHDTVLRPADCGGPVVDLDGRVVGINIARAGRVASYALPSEVLRPIVREMVEGNFESLFADARGDRHEQIEHLQEKVRQWSERFAELQEQLDAAKDRVVPGVNSDQSAGEGSKKVSETSSTEDNVQLTGLVRLQIATESAKVELEKALAALRKVEGVEVALPPESE